MNLLRIIWMTDDFNNSRYGGYFVTPEARIVTSVFKELQPDVYIDIHHRGFNYLSEDDNRQVYIQVAAEVADPYDDPFTGDHYEVIPQRTDTWQAGQRRRMAFSSVGQFRVWRNPEISQS